MNFETSFEYLFHLQIPSSFYKKCGASMLSVGGITELEESVFKYCQ